MRATFLAALAVLFASGPALAQGRWGLGDATTVRKDLNASATQSAVPPPPPDPRADVPDRPSVTGKDVVPRPRSVDEVMWEVADEYVSTLPFDRVRSNELSQGYLLPQCRGFPYPELGGATTGADRERLLAAIRGAYVKANLQRLGLEEGQADFWAKYYFRGRVDYSAQTPEQQSARRRDGTTPEDDLAQQVNGTNAGRAGFPTLRGRKDCEAVGGNGEGSVSSALNAVKRTPYSLNPVPSGGRIFLVSEFEYLVCDRRNLDPQDRSQCAAWEQIAAGQPKPLIGRYRYAVEWPDGRRASEYHTFEYLGDRARSYDIPAPAPGERKARNS